MAEIQPLKSKILKLAKSSSAAATILHELQDDSSEGIVISLHELQDDSSEGIVISLSLLRLLIYWVSLHSFESYLHHA